MHSFFCAHHLDELFQTFSDCNIESCFMWNDQHGNAHGVISAMSTMRMHSSRAGERQLFRNSRDQFIRQLTVIRDS